MRLLTTLGQGARSAGTSIKEGLKTGAKETFRASLMANLMDDGNKSLSQRIGGAIGDSFREATFGQMGALGKALTAGGDKSKAGKSPTSGGGVQGQGIKYQQIKTDNVITAINQSSQQIVGALNTMNATQRMGFNAQTNQIQAQAQAMDTLSGYGEDTVIALREIYELLNRQGYSSGSRAGAGGGSSLPSYQGGSTPQAANDNGNSSGVIGDTLLGALAGGVLGAGGALLAGGRKLLGKAGDATAKAGEKILGKAGEKALVKSALKKLPGIGIIAGLAFGVDRLMDGDLLGAGGEVLSGVLGTVPGLGTAASVAVDAGLAARDFGAFGEAGSADAAPVDAEPATGNSSEGTELTKEESLNVIHAFQKQYGRFGSRDEILQFAQSMYPGRKFSKLISTIDKLEKSTGPQSSLTSNVQLASNEILPGMLGSGDYLSQRQQQLDASRQGSEIPTLSGTFGPDTSEGSLRQQEANLEKAAKDNTTKIEISAREVVYKADSITFDTDTLKFLYKSKEEGAAGSSGNAPGGGDQGGGGNEAPAPVAAPMATPGGGAANWGAVGGTESRDGSGVIPPQGGATGLGGQKTTTEQNKQLFLDAMNKGGITDPEMRAAMAAVTQGESGFNPKSESDYSKTSNDRIRGIFGKRVGNMSDAELTQLKNNPEAFFNKVYGGMLGNDQNEGYKYRGRGYFQLTGKANYKKYGDMIGVDLVKNPDLANDPQIAAQIAVAYMKDRYKSAKGNSTKEKVFRAVGNPVASTEKVKNSAFSSYMQSGAFAPGKQADLSGLPTSPNGAQMTNTGAPPDPPLPQAYQTASGTTGTGTDLAGQATQASGPLDAAKKMLGMNENRDYQQLQNFLNQYSGTPPLSINTKSGPWCAKFVNGVLGSQGIPGSGSNMAKSFLNYGGAVFDKASGQGDPKQAQPGDIAVFNRGGGSSGHVAFVESISGDTVSVVGGNQSDGAGGGVTRSKRKLSEVISIRRPGASGPVAQNAQIPSAGAGGGGTAPMGGAASPASGGTFGGAGLGGSTAGLGSMMGGGNPLASMLGGGGSPFGAIGNMLGGVVGQLSSATSLFSASGAGGAPSTTMNVASAGPLPDRSRREGPSARNPSPGMDDTLADLIKHAFG